MSIDPSTVVWVIIDFVVLAFLLNRFLFKPVLTFMRERQERIDAGIAAGKQAEQDLERKQAELSERLSQAKADASEKIAELTEQSIDGDNSALTDQTTEDRRIEAAARLYLKEEQLSDITREHAPELVAILEKRLISQLEGQTMPATDGEKSEDYRALARQAFASAADMRYE